MFGHEEPFNELDRYVIRVKVLGGAKAFVNGAPEK